MPTIDQDIERAFQIKKKGDRLLSEGQPEEALELFGQAEELCQKWKSWLGLAQIYTAQGFAFEKLQSYHQAINKFEHASNIFNANDRELDAAKAGCNIGAILLRIGDFNKAANLFHKAIIIYKKFDEPILEAHVESDIASVLIGQGKILEGLEKLRKVRATFKQGQLLDGLVLVDMKIAGANFLLGNLDEAYLAYEDCKNYYLSKNHLPTIAILIKSRPKFFLIELNISKQ